MLTSEISKDYMITLPKEVLDALGVSSGGRISSNSPQDTPASKPKA